MNLTTDAQGPTMEDRLDATAGELRASREETAEMTRRRDAWKERANRLAADNGALQLAVAEITQDRDRVSRELARSIEIAVQLAAKVKALEVEHASTVTALEQANARVAELDGQRTTAVTVAESAELGWKNAAADLEAETKRANRLEAFLAELALAIGQPALRGQELLDHVRETEALVGELRQVCAEQKHELRCDAERQERHRSQRAELLQVVDQLLRGRRALERESEMVATRDVPVACDCDDTIPWDDSPAPELCPGCLEEQAEIAAAQVLARLEDSHA